MAGAPSKLSDALRDEMIAKVASGWSYGRCAEWLKRSHGIDVSRQALAEQVKRHRTELVDASKATIRARAAKTADGAMTALQRRLERAVEIVAATEDQALTCPDKESVDAYAKAAGAFARIHELVSKATGLDQPDAPAFDGLVEALGLELDARDRVREEEAAQYAATQH